MNFRLATEKDTPTIDAMWEREGLETPQSGLCFVAENEDGIQGFIHAATTAVIDGFISDVPLATSTLYEKMITALEVTGHKSIWMLPSNPEIQNLALRKNFKIIKNREIVMRKELTNGQ